MGNTNVVVIQGHLVASAELKYWNDQTPYCNFCIANNESYKNQNGEWVSIPSFFDCTLTGKYAEAMAKYLNKGRGITVEGRLKQNRWEKDGQKFSRIFIKVSNITDLAPASGENTSQQQPQQIQQQAPQQVQQQKSFNAVQNTFGGEAEKEPDFVPFAEMPEDIPF